MDGGRTALLVLALAAAPATAQDFRYLVPSASSCAGCSEGGLGCFGQNTCEAGCLDQVVRDCCNAELSRSACCPACPQGCSANQPCNGTGEAYSVVLDGCPNPGVESGCKYYARKSACLEDQCDYYAKEAPKRCVEPPPTVSGFPPLTLACIRDCLQIADAELGSECGTGAGCTKLDCIVDYHRQCFDRCGVAPALFPASLFRWFGDHDGN